MTTFQTAIIISNIYSRCPNTWIGLVHVNTMSLFRYWCWFSPLRSFYTEMFVVVERWK